MFVNKSLNNALRDLLKSDEKILLIGEDILDPYGGAFKVTKGLSDKFPKQVYPTPISEASIVGVGTGLSMLGFKPIVEIMFMDFSVWYVCEINFLDLRHSGFLGNSLIVITLTPAARASPGYGRSLRGS